MNGRWQVAAKGSALVTAVGLAAFGLTTRVAGHTSPARSSAPVAVTVTVQPADETQPAPETTEDAAVAAPKPPSTPSQLDDTLVWQLIGDTRSAAGDDTSRQSELLKESLMRLDPNAIVEFAQIRARLDRRAYTWGIWGAASVIEDGCSDDCFRDFRSYLISLGRGPYEAALRDPDSLATVAEGAERGDWESADDVAADAYSAVTGEDFPLDDSDVTGRPSGRRWTETELPRLYPNLTARFR